MQHEIKPLELLFLWRLAAAGGGDWLKDVKPDPGAPARKRLEASGLIAQVKQKPPGGRAQALHVSLADEGWAWLGGHLDADLNTKSTAGADVLRLLLARLKTFLDRKNLSLGDFMAPGESAAGPPAIDDPKACVTTAYYALSDGRANARVRLADLRRELAAIPRPVLDGALLDLATSGEASLYRLDNPAEIRAEDRDAVLRTPSGEERHIVYLGGRGS
ncbi:hypothetical protein [Paludisphaera borealis]|uniref:Uncharacterized protein n=1 Tax=Paludisphaera borealis TaxID=1387353 RepID=A0A1U7CS08_9BACT|nr:hypothetical protein [Paludisphaera borealis]APW61679.1 hypothetical protein BSF38_03204 [Paludisphaera borealis]